MSVGLAHSNKLHVILSDIEMGGGGKEDDFPHTHFLASLIRSYNGAQYKDLTVSFVLNGDTFDFLKTSVHGLYPHLINEEIALEKLARVEAAHAEFFVSLKEFLAHDPKRRLIFLVGNHDPEILFPSVQERIRSLCGHREQVEFPGFNWDDGDVHIEHGAQRDSMFNMNEDKPFIIYKGDSYLNLPWSSVCLLNVVLPMQKDFYLLDRMKPKKLLIEILPEVKDLLMGKFWSYWTKSYLTEYLKSADPLKKVTWPMIKEMVKRSSNFSAEVEMDQFFHKKMQESERTRLYMIGHQHEAFVWSYGNRKVIQTGCFRDEFMIESAGKSLVPIPKSYAEVFMYNHQLVASRLLEISCPEQRDFIPALPHSFLPKLKEHLGTADEQMKEKMAMEREEKKASLI
jgi:UDP-2,3-diacylglucosamine pyrophosphatase LpxH